MKFFFPPAWAVNQHLCQTSKVPQSVMIRIVSILQQISVKKGGSLLKRK